MSGSSPVCLRDKSKRFESEELWPKGSVSTSVPEMEDNCAFGMS